MQNEGLDLAPACRAHAGARYQEPLSARAQGEGKVGGATGLQEGLQEPLSASEKAGVARVVAIASHKGGVAKTTTALGLSAGLARKGARVLLIDLDGQGSATRGLFGRDVDYRAPGTADLLCDAPLAIAELARETSVPGLSMLLATR